MSKALISNNYLSDIANAIREKNNESNLYLPSEMAAKIMAIPTSGGSSTTTNAGVKFIDYDGTIVKSYTAEEFLELSALPANPVHTGLIAQGWNWNLTDAKVYVQNYGALNIGQMYITTSNKTEVDIKLFDGRLSPTLGLYIDGTIKVDWGDNSEVDTLTGENLKILKKITHNYNTKGIYTFTIEVINGSFTIKDNNFISGIENTSNSTHAYRNSVQKIRLGKGVSSIGDYAFSYCYSLASITIPDNVTSIGNSAFGNCYSLTSVTIPDNVTSIGNSAFGNCRSLAYVYLSSVTPPSLGASVFTNVPPDFKIYVPEQSLEEYKTATNWSTWSSYMVGK